MTISSSCEALEILDEKLSQEDVNQKLLRSLSPEWNTHALVWRNKADLDIMSMDDLYNNLKITTLTALMEQLILIKQLILLKKFLLLVLNPKWSATTAIRRDILLESRALRNQDNKNKESSRRSVPVETSTSTALVSCDGLGDNEP
ncbi:hypothetical protein Tco_0409154 [Tanacetum coccineum]